MDTTSTTPDATTTEQPSLAPTVGEQCVACGAPLAADQRYCVECGERAGQPRLPYMDGRQTPLESEAPRQRRRRPKASAGLTLIGGIATLLLAMGVGVLIGRSGDNGTTKAASQPVQVVTVSGAAGSSTTAGTNAQSTTAGSTTSAGNTNTNASKSDKGKSKASTTTQPAKSKAATPPAAVTVGSKGSGKGYKDGKFTGDFFGP